MNCPFSETQLPTPTPREPGYIIVSIDLFKFCLATILNLLWLVPTTNNPYPDEPRGQAYEPEGSSAYKITIEASVRKSLVDHPFL